MLFIHISNEEAIRLEIIDEKLKFFAVSTYLDIEEQIENRFKILTKYYNSPKEQEF